MTAARHTSVPLVTGATGFAGGHLLDHLLESEPLVMAWGNPSGQRVPGAARAGGDRIRWYGVDVTDPVSIERALCEAPPSIVYHCAGLADVQRAWANPAEALRVNALGTRRVLATLERTGLDVPVVVTGSALVYRFSPAVLTEDSPIGPSGPYALSKLAQEMIAAQATLARVVLARPFNHAGPRQSDSYVTSGFARQIAEAEAGLRPRVLRAGNLDARRDITDVRDTVRAYALLGRHGQARRPYNICRGDAYRVGDLLDILLTRARVPMIVEPDPARLRPSDTPIVLGSAERIRIETGWEPRVSIERTLEDLLEHWRRSVSPGGRT